MTFIVLELFPEPYILTNMDGEIWKTDLATAKELAEECQQGMVVPLDVELMYDVVEAFGKPISKEHTIIFYEQNTTT